MSTTVRFPPKLLIKAAWLTGSRGWTRADIDISYHSHPGAKLSIQDRRSYQKAFKVIARILVGFVLPRDPRLWPLL
jgi:hypothetical protein